jgi:hypothetical protein
MEMSFLVKKFSTLVTQKRTRKKREYAVADTLFSFSFLNHQKFEKKVLFLEEISPHFGTVFTVL